MYCSASSPASGSTTFSSEPIRKTTACRAARSSGSAPTSSGMSGKTAAPSAPSPPSGRGCSSAMSASGDRGDDAHLVAVLQGGGEAVQVADVLVVDVDVDE